MTEPLRVIYSSADVLGALREFVAGQRDQKSAAAVLDISPQYLNDLLAGRRAISPEIGRLLGYTHFNGWVKAG